jgi:2-methylisocitrate lyase-like PEP mutase family enzyme
MDKNKSLKDLILDKQILIMPDAYCPISAKLIQKAGFKAVQCSGYSFSIAAGYPRECSVSLEENLEWTRRIVESVDIPVMADAEDGYGGVEGVIDTVEKFIETGVAGLNLEDQILDEKSTVSVIDEYSMVQKIINARETADKQNKPGFIINGRTDALRLTEDRSEGLELAIRRANQYLKAGADLAFITYVETLDEVKEITRKVRGPVSIAAGLPYNIKNFSIHYLQKYGVARVSLPTLLILSSLKAMENSLNYLNEDNMQKTVEKGCLYSVKDLDSLLNK